MCRLRPATSGLLLSLLGLQLVGRALPFGEPALPVVKVGFPDVQSLFSLRHPAFAVIVRQFPLVGATLAQVGEDVSLDQRALFVALLIGHPLSGRVSYLRIDPTLVEDRITIIVGTVRGVGHRRIISSAGWSHRLTRLTTRPAPLQGVNGGRRGYARISETSTPAIGSAC